MARFLWTFVKQQKKYVFPYLLLSLGIAILLTYRAYLYANLFDALVGSLSVERRGVFLHSLLLAGITEGVLFFVRIGSVAVYSMWRGYMNLTVRIFGLDKVLKLDFHDLAKLGSGKLLQIVHSGMESYSFLIYDGIARSVELLVSLVAIILLLSLENIWFLSYFVLGIFFLILFQKYAFGQLKDARFRDRELNESYTKQTTKILMNYMLLKVFGIKEQELQHLYEIGSRRVDNFMRIKFWFNGVASFANFLLIGLLFLTLRYFGKLYLAGETSLEVFFFVFLLISFSRQQFYAFGVFTAELSEKLTYIHRFDEIMEQADSKSEEESGVVLEKLDLPIRFDEISFRHEGQSDLLYEGLNLEITPGSHVAIMGKSGSGKSTLLNMLTRLIRPERGNIYLGETKLSEISFACLYQKLGYFYQDPLVFDGTVRQNLTFLETHTDEQLRDALRCVELDSLGLETVIGERGILLSGGEKQRLALARVFLHTYDILLLDEPTSNLDIELEQKILKKLFEKYKDKTVIIISHRPYVLEHVERVLVFQKGMVIHDGDRESVQGLLDERSSAE